MLAPTRVFRQPERALHFYPKKALLTNRKPRLRRQTGLFLKILFAKTKKTTAIAVIFVVENTGIEPVTSCMPCKRSPS